MQITIDPRQFESVIHQAVETAIARFNARLNDKGHRPDPLLADRKTAASLLAVSPNTITNLVTAGVLKPVRIGSSVRFSVADLQAYIQTHRGDSPTV